MEFLKNVKLKAGVAFREWKENAQARKAAKPQDPPNVTVSAELVRGVKFASWVAYFALMYFLWERVLDVSQAQHSTLEVTHFGIWSNLNLAIFFPLIVGYVFVVIGVPYVAKISIPTLVSLNWTEHFWPKLVSLFITLLVSTVLITGTATVGSNAIIESERGAAVAVAELQQSRTVLESQLERRRGELRDMMNNSNAYLAQAASVGAEEWQRSYIAQTPANDPQRDRIVRAIGAARSADAVRADIRQLETQLDGMQTTAAVSSEVVTERTQTLNGVMDFLNTFWVLMLAVVMDLTCLFMPWIAMRLEQKRNAQMGMADGIALHPYMLEKPRAGEKPVVRPEEFAGRRAQDVVDAMIAGGADPRWAADMARSAARATEPDELAFDEDGAPLTRVEYWKRQDGKPLVKKQKNRVIVPPGPIPPDETGFQDTARSGVTLGGVMELPESADAEPTPEASGAAPEAGFVDERVHEGKPDDTEQEADQSAVLERTFEQTDLSDDEAALALQEYDLTSSTESPQVESQHNEAEDASSGESEDQIDHQETSDREEPETNPARMIAAE